jgi:hypothetical protein
LARDDADRIILGVFDAGGGRSSDVLIATDINFWDTTGWTDSRNRDLWENIWQAAESQTTGPTAAIPTLNEWGMLITVMLLGLISIYYIRKTHMTA